MNPTQPTSPRRRLQELLAIPDSQRTDEQWDELNELEIKLAPGNRESSSDGNGGREGREGNAPQQGRPGGQRNNGQNKRPRKFHKRPPKVGGGAGGGNNSAP
jgi:hypothetical protein